MGLNPAAMGLKPSKNMPRHSFPHFLYMFEYESWENLLRNWIGTCRRKTWVALSKQTGLDPFCADGVQRNENHNHQNYCFTRLFYYNGTQHPPETLPGLLSARRELVPDCESHTSMRVQAYLSTSADIHEHPWIWMSWTPINPHHNRKKAICSDSCILLSGEF